MLVGVETFHHHILQQIVTSRQQDHALMMRHVGLHDGVCLSFWETCFGVIERLVKTKTSEHVQALQVRHIFQHGLGL